jgi:hypothetical protein
MRGEAGSGSGTGTPRGARGIRRAGFAALNAIQLLCLLYILIRIPSWIGRRVWSGAGRGPLASAAPYAVAAVVVRRVSPVLSGRRRRGP